MRANSGVPVDRRKWQDVDAVTVEFGTALVAENLPGQPDPYVCVDGPNMHGQG
ncbi:hypothetical protein GE107_14160 [Cohnella sp. CFH 77786]|uniref:hypothetical protein n=1 Tax=Cohnella sp. CFH 77786 TaxID=2662265 RepID=UPI001C60F29E|nr:hypothetical protein [Cohnella sp. CFH 77786]MBW5447197.1 hypothetical protein [Cohnella sp. CFH 77786]